MAMATLVKMTRAEARLELDDLKFRLGPATDARNMMAALGGRLLLAQPQALTENAGRPATWYVRLDRDPSGRWLGNTVNLIDALERANAIGRHSAQALWQRNIQPESGMSSHQANQLYKEQKAYYSRATRRKVADAAAAGLSVLRLAAQAATPVPDPRNHG